MMMMMMPGIFTYGTNTYRYLFRRYFGCMPTSSTSSITRPKPAYGRQGLAGSWGQDTDEVRTFLVFLTSHFAPAALSSDLTNLGPLMTMKIHLETLKNHGNQPKTMKNHETTLKNHGNQAKTMKPPWKTMETNQKPRKFQKKKFKKKFQ